MQITVSNAGRQFKGNIQDIDLWRFNRIIKSYDPLLYVKWNPKKRNGRGIWELRRRPKEKTQICQGMFNGGHLFTLEYQELDIINHVLDMPYLSERICEKLRQMDTWAVDKWVDRLEEAEQANIAKHQKAAAEEMRQRFRDERKYLKIFKDEVTSGLHPGFFLAGTYDSKK